jgi:hypothetical protein
MSCDSRQRSHPGNCNFRHPSLYWLLGNQLIRIWNRIRRNKKKVSDAPENGMTPQPTKGSRYLQHPHCQKAAPATKRIMPLWPQHVSRCRIFGLLGDSCKQEVEDHFLLILKNEKNKPWRSAYSCMPLTDQSSCSLPVAVAAAVVAVLHQRGLRCHRGWHQSFQRAQSAPVLNGSAEACP